MNVLFYTEPIWAYGAIHYELAKYLFSFGINSFIAPWNVAYKIEEMVDYNLYYKYILTSCHGYRALTSFYPPGLINPKKIIVVGHAESDILEISNFFDGDEFFKFHKFAVVSDYLKRFCNKLNIKRTPEVCELGINYDLYYSEPSLSLKSIGYAGAFGRHDPIVKRQHLIKQIADETKLELKVAHGNYTNYINMGTFYRSVDAVLVSSSVEGAGLPALEASAAGKLVISTDVGHWKERSKESYGYTLPIDEDLFVKDSIKILNFYKENQEKYREKCFAIREHAKNYDWSKVISPWVNLFS